jgi:hypothetical protein
MRNERSGHPVLGLIAYALVRGERRRTAEGHFRRAGLEALKGLRSLMRSGGPEEPARQERRKIEIE